MTFTDAMAFRAAQQSFIAEEFSNIVEDDLGLTVPFLDLCCDTHVALGGRHWSNGACFRPCATSAWNLACPLHDKTRSELPADLQQRWLAWREDYAELVAHNPRLDLADRMQDISEIEDGSSWPYGHEGVLKAWVDSGDITRFPFRMRSEFPTQIFYRSLQDLRRKTRGWLYWQDEIGRVVYVQDEC